MLVHLRRHFEGRPGACSALRAAARPNVVATRPRRTGHRCARTPSREKRAGACPVAKQLAGWDSPGVHPRTVVRRELEIDAGSEPLQGRLLEDGQSVRGFRGWLELFAAIEELRTGVKPGGPSTQGGIQCSASS